MRKISLGLTLFILANLYLLIPAYGANDAPHNNSNNISCGSCHSDTLLSSPFWGVPDDTTFNNFCINNCHNAPFAPYTDTSAPLVQPHSSTTTSTTYGTWSINCVECHDPHVQKQKFWKGTLASELYLATGITDNPSPTYDAPSNTSLISYGSINYKSGWDISLITNKSLSERRAILFPNLKKLGYSYTVVEIDNPVGTIKVEGDATEPFSFVSPPTNFAITYGQYIKQAIDVNGTLTSVKMFGNTGSYSFAYDESLSGTDPTPDGICQVCHENTTHWNKDGSGAAIGIHAQFNGGNCTKCHRHSDGFKNIYVDHSAAGMSYILENANCVSCHIGPEPVIDIHKKNCSYCHKPDMTLQDGLSPGDCTNCHGLYVTDFQAGHLNETHVELTGATNCTTTCHSGDVITVLHSNTCTKCHTNTTTNGTLRVGAGGNGDATPHLLGTPSTCVVCHADYNTNFQTAHDVKDHTGIAPSSNCTTTCHTQTTVADIINVTHATKGCTNCHSDMASNGTLVTATNGDASNGSGNCAFCHSDYNTNFENGHKVKDHDGVTASANCATTCHSTDPITGVHQSNCTDCHTNTVADGTLTAGGNGYGDASGGSGSCADCHPAYDANFSVHVVGDHSGVIANQAPFMGIINNCAGCHTGDVISAVVSGTDPGTHQNDCSNCHVNTGGDGTLKDGSNNYGDATNHVVGTTSDCDACHLSDNYFPAHTHTHTVSLGGGDVSQETGATCSNCHNDNGGNLATWTDILVEHESSCYFCHNSTRDTSKSSTYSIAKTIQDVISANAATTCADCHRDKIDSISADATHGTDHVGEGKVTGDAQCTGCHDQAGNANNTQYLNVIHGTCGKCHVATTGGGPLHDYSVSGGTINDLVNYENTNYGDGGSCATCHVRYATNFETGHQNEDHAHVKTTTNATPTLNCGGCHTGNIITAAQNHNSDCTYCHTNTTTDGTFTSGVRGDATVHTIGSDSECADCHNAAYFINHTHAHTVSQGVGDISQELAKPCSDCHDDNSNALAVWADILVEHVSDCTICHDETRNTSKSGTYSIGQTIQDVIAANANPTNCDACHRDKIDTISAESIHGLDHVGQGRVLGETQCMGCHDPSGNANNIQFLNVIHGTCGKCHVAARGAGALHDYSGSGGTISQFTNYETVNGGAGGACNVCHAATFSLQHSTVAHDTFVSLSTDCSGCHSGTEGLASGMVVNASDNKVHDSCAQCHGTTGVLVGSATGKSGANSCNDCHGDFATIHSTVDHSTSVAMATDCNLCHSGAEGAVGGMVVDNTDGKKHDSCAQCHGTTGALVSVAIGNTDPNDCEDCHGAYFPSHINPDAHHDNRTIAFGALSNPCDKCHKSDTSLGLGVPGAGALASQSDIDSLHGRATNACNLCHFYNNATQSNDEGLPLAATVTNAIVNGMDDDTPVAASCMTCHSYNEDPAIHGGHLVPDNITTKLKTCTVCHDRDEDNPLLVVDDIHNLTCANCHETPQPPTLVNPATKPNADFIVKGDCGDCHGVDYDHDNDTHSKITYGDDGAGNLNCIGCHVADPITEHIDIRGWECSVCHRNPCFDTVINDAINGVTTTVYCTDCHTDRDFPHGMIDHVGLGVVSEELLCSVCHNPTGTLDWMTDIHGNGTDATCDLCHVNPAGAGPLIAVLEGDGSAVDGGVCSECHNASISMPNIGAFHGTSASDSETINRHNNLAGATGVAATSTNPNIIVARTTYKCNDCHLARTVEERLNEHPGCVTCHNGITDFEAVITAGMTSGGNTVQDCEACHNNTINGGGTTNSPTGKAMYQYDGDRHHALEPAQKGRCDYCHADPRPDWTVTYGATLPVPLPTQLACDYCHMDKAANGVVVKKNTYNPSDVYYPTTSGFTLSSVSSVQQTTQHTITGIAPIAVTNYGACLFCHTVNIWHAKPNWDKDVNDTKTSNKDDTFDVLRLAPGRSYWPSKPTSTDNDPTDNGGIAKFDIFSSAVNTGGVTKARMFGRYNFGSANKPYEKTGSENRGDKLYKSFKTNNPWINTLANAPLGFTRVTVPQIDAVNDVEELMSSDPQVPVFPAISEPALTGEDLVTIIDSGWNDGNNNRLKVMAVNRHDDSVALSVTYGSQIVNLPMIWDATLGAWTYTSANTIILDGSDVEVTSNHAGGGSNTITPRDMTVLVSEAGASATTQEHINQAANNIPADVLAAGACTDCHQGNLAAEHASRGKSCSVCHAPCAVPPTPLSSVDCYTCHPARPADHPADVIPDHFFLEYEPSKCVSCHSSQDIETVTHTSCSKCHDATFDLDNMQSGPSGNAKLHVLLSNSGCTVCHPGQGADFAGGHFNEDHALITASAQCVSCHSGADRIADVHNNNCNNCHTDSTTDGTLIGSAAGHTIGVASACADCHTNHAANFVTGHQNEDHANVIAATSGVITENCVGCHPGNVITDAAIHNNICEKCHTNQTTNGSLRSGPKGDATTHTINTQSDCADCHTAYFNGHSHVHTIIEIDAGTDLAQSDFQPCFNCHNDNAGNLGSWTDILVEHRNDCTTCHNATRDINPGAPTGTTIQDIIATKTDPTNCLDCHANKAGPASHDINHPLQGRVTGSAQCISCHDKDNEGTNSWYISTIHDASGGGCGTCHVSASGGGPLVDYSGGGSTINDNVNYEAINGGAGGSCVDCHVRYGNNFGTGHQNQDHSGVGTTANCVSCHTGDKITGANTHNGSCTRCHTHTVTDGSLKAGTNGTALLHYLGSTSVCTDCHAGYATDFSGTHAVGDHSGISATASCASCHSDNVISGANVHNNACSLCHTNTTTNGTLISGANGDATNHSLGGTSSCLTCHTDYTPDFADAGAHKVQDHSGLIDPVAPATTTEDCTSCHDGVDTRPNVEWFDDFEALTTGHAGRSTFGNWTGVNGSDGTNPWMVWTGSAATPNTGATSGAALSTKYLMLESSGTSASSAAVTRLDSNWSTTQANTTGTSVINYTVPTGANRVIVATVSAEDAGLVNITGVTFGGQSFTHVASATQGAGYSNETWIGICNETCISNAVGNVVNATFTGTHSTGFTLGVATFENVDQTTPVSDSASLNNALDTISTSVTNPSGGKVIYMVEYNGVGGNTITPASGFTEIAEFDTTGSGFRSEIGERTSTASGSVSIAPSHAAPASNRTTIVALALNPAPGDVDATNGVNVTSNSTHYLESGVLDASASSLTFKFSWNMNVPGNSDTSLHVDGWNGSSWDTDINGGAINTGNKGNTWYESELIDLNSYNNSDFKLRIRYEVGTGATYTNDIALDNLEVTGIPKVPTLFSWNDNFTGLTTGAAGRSSFSHWTGVNGSDGKNPWMVWTGASATTSGGPSTGSGGSGNYLMVESSPTTPAPLPDPVVTRLGNWSTDYTIDTTTTTLDYTVPAGSDRVLVVTLTAEDDTIVDITGATYGGQTLTEVDTAFIGTGYSNQAWIGICDESCIAAASNTTVAATFGGTGIFTGMTIGAVTFENVNQTTPINDNASTTSTTSTISVNVTNANNGKVIYVAGFNDVGANTLSPPSGFTEIAEFDTTVDGYRAEIGERTSTASGSVTVNPTNSGLASSRTTLVAIALKPSPTPVGDSDATNGVDIVSNSTHYLESDVMDASAASITFSFDWNMNVGDNSDASLHIDAWNGSTWDSNIGGTVKTGDNGDTWTTKGPISFSSYTNADFKVRLRYEVGTGTIYDNDLALDNMKLIGADRNVPLGDVHYDECALCHDAGGSGELQTGSRGDATGHVLGVDSECSSCHGAFGYFESHLHAHDVRQGSTDIAQSNSQACSNCHGVVSMWSNILTIHDSDCGNCHNGTRDINPSAPVGITVQQVIKNAVSTVRCLDCHVDKTAPADHGVIDHEGLGKVTWTARCAVCHDASGNEDPIYDVHKVGTKNMCGVCHQNPYGVGPLREPWETDTPSGGECTTCHGTDVKDAHHAKEQAQGGDCTYCHADPRAGWISTYSTMTPSPMAKQLPCVKCHVEPTGTGLVVYANTYNPTSVTGFPSGTNSLAISGGSRVQQTPVHTILGQNKINVYDFGACLGCHDGNYAGAPQIQIWHAKPTWDKNTHDTSAGVYNNPFDALRYAPGRSEINNSGTVIDSKFNLFYNGANTGTTKLRTYGRYNFGSATKPYKGSSSQNRGKNLYGSYKNDGSNPWYNDIYSQTFQIPCIAAVNDPEGICNGTDPYVPYYNDIAVPVIKDNVLILKAEWDGTSLSVWAYNDYHDAKNLTFNYAGTVNNAMTWNAASTRWEGTLTAPYASTVTVNSDSAGGGSDTANVTDLSTTPDIIYATKSEWTSDNGGTITIWAEHLLNNGSLSYHVDYGFVTLGDMTWHGVERRYELVKTGVQYLGEVLATIESLDPGGDSVDIPVEDVSGPPDDVVYATRAVWDGNNLDTLTIYATHKLNIGTLTYKVDYNGNNNMVMTWKPTRFRYELVVEGITYNGAAQARIYSEDPGGDDILVDVTDISGIVDHEGLGHVTQTAECSKCHNWNPNDPKDVVTDIHRGKCTLCHNPVWPLMQAGITAGNCEHCHAPDYHPAATLHDQITYGYGGNSCLMSCHKPVPLDEHLTGAVTGRTWQCTSCHASPFYIGIINAAIPNTYNVYCTDCHSHQTFPHGVREHNITNLGNCVSCHSSVDVVNVTHKKNCETCHNSAVTAVQDTITAGGGTCADCHAEEYQHNSIGYHNNNILPSCNKCHTTSTFEQIVDTHRDTCATCHTSTDSTVISVINTGGAVSCDDCHTWDPADRHHLNEQADVGNCEYCHADPRNVSPLWPGTPGDNGNNYGTNVPTQMACIECHVTFSGGNLHVTQYERSDFVDYSTDWTRTTVHTIPNSAGRINNYGICFNCHEENPDNAYTATTVQVWHARPDIKGGANWVFNTDDSNRNRSTNDRAHYVAGREYDGVGGSAVSAVSSGIGGFNLFRGQYWENGTNSPKGSSSVRLEYDGTPSATPSFTRITVPDVAGIGDNSGRGTLNVPVFASLSPQVASVPDVVTITMAHWYETNQDTHVGKLLIHAVNQETDTLQYNASDMTEVGNHWEITVLGVLKPADVTITSTNGNGGDDTRVVTDMTCYDCYQDNTIPHDYIENLVDPSCGECHYASLPDEHVAHGLNCSTCHESTDLTVQQAIVVGVYGGVTCETCHGVRTAEHPYDLHAHSAHLDPTDLAQADSQPCDNCHVSSTFDEIAKPLHDVPDNGLGACNTCHMSPRAEVIDTIKYRTTGNAHCLSCHSVMTAPAVHGKDHPISLGAGDLGQSDSQPCSNCHGSLASWKDIYIVHQSNCDVCHTATRDINVSAPTGTTIDEVVNTGVAPFGPFECMSCHPENAAPAEHGLEHHHIVPGIRDSAYNATLTCFTVGCHAESTYTEHMKPGGIAYQKYEDLGTSFECDWCHQYRPVEPGSMTYNDDPVINAAISTGVNDMADVYCNDCHKYNTQRLDPQHLNWTAKYADPEYRISTEHHANHTDALNGDCNTCHVDLRENRYGAGVPVPTPKKLACIACHVEVDPLGGTYGTGEMRVYKSKTATLQDHGTYYDWHWSFQDPIANTDPVGQTGMPHRWDVVGGIIDNFGTCLFCHRIGPFHAQPSGPPADDVDKDVVDLVNDPPYMSMHTGRGLFNAFFASHRSPLNYYSGFAQDANQVEYREIRDSESWAKDNVTWAKVIYDPSTDPRLNVAATHTMGTPEEFIVPTFDDPAGGDTVSITNTTFNSGPLTLDITATNTSTGQGYELYAIHDGRSVLMTESPAGTWNATITGYPNDISDEIGAIYVISVDPGSNNITLAQDATNPTPVINNSPSLVVTGPGGAGGTVTQGNNYVITYNLSDSEDIVTAAFYYDTDNTGLNGTAIGNCSTQPEATGGTCIWDTTGVTPGSYYIYAVTNDGSNPQITDYSSGKVTINAPSATLGSGASGTVKSSTESWQLSMYDLNNPFTAAPTGTVTSFSVNVTNPGNFTLFVCAPSGGEGGTCAVNATTNVSTGSTGIVTWTGLSMPISNGEVIGIWHALGDGIGEKTTVGFREQYQMNAPTPTTSTTVNGTNYGVSLMMEATVSY